MPLSRARRRLVLAALAGVAVLLALGAWLARPPPAAHPESRLAQAQVTLGAVAAAAIPQDDLPPAGTRSLFDHLLAQNDGLPYPFERLVALMQRQAPEGAAPLAVLIPLGRSLLKASADFHLPRVVYAADYQSPGSPASLGVAPRGQLFLGFTEGADEIEVISYNEAAGRFEFQLVQNYCAGCVPRIVYARRAICQTCHQGGAPIFSVRPWAETSGQPQIAERIAGARGPQPYLSVPVEVPLAAPERVDELTDVGNFIHVTQRIWLDGCGADGAQCRRLMLRLALRFVDDPSAFDAAGAEAVALRALQARHWPAQGIAVPNNDLASRDPLAEARTWRARLRSLFADDVIAVRDNEDLDRFARLPGLPAPLDPLSPRAPKTVLTAQDLDGVFGLAQLLTPDDHRRLLDAARGDLDLVLDAVQRLPDAAFAARPFSRVLTVQALLAQLSGSAPAYCCLDTAEMSPPVSVGVPRLQLAAGSPLAPFERHCFACHRGNPAQRLDFMSGQTEAEVLAAIQATASIRDALDWERFGGTEHAAKIMPPADSAQHAALRAELAQNPQLLDQMRDVVPGMFDF